MSASEMSAVNTNPAEEESRERIEVAIVGGGQAGLAMGYFLESAVSQL